MKITISVLPFKKYYKYYEQLNKRLVCVTDITKLTKVPCSLFYCFLLLTDTIFDTFSRNHASFSELAQQVVFCH